MPKASNRKKVGDIEENILNKAYLESISNEQLEATEDEFKPIETIVNTTPNHLSRLNNHPRRNWLITALVGSLIFFLLIVGFATRDLYLWGSFEGFVKDPTGKPIAAAKLSYGDNQTFTDTNGFYRFLKTPLRSTLKIEAARFKPFEQNLVLANWTQEQRNFSLEYISFSTAYGELIPPSDKPLSGLEMFLDDQKIPLNDKIFNIGPVEVGKHKLRFNSNQFKTIELNLDLLPGENDLGKINLVSVENIQLQILDWGSGQPIKSSEVKLLEQSFVSDDAGIVTIPNWEVNQNQKVIIAATGYLSKELTLDTKDLKVYLINEGKIAYVSDRSGIDNVFVSNFDGSQEQLLTDFKTGFIQEINLVNDTIWFTSNFEGIKSPSGQEVFQAYKLALNGGQVGRVSNIEGSSYSSEISQDFTFDLSSLLMIKTRSQQTPGGVYVSNLWLSNIDGVNERLIRNRSFVYPQQESVNSTVISSDGQKLAYILNKVENRDSYEENVRASLKILSLNSDGSDVRTIVEESATRYSLGNYDLFGYSPDNQNLVYFQRKNNEMAIVVYSYKTSKNLTIQSNEVFDYDFSGDSKYFYYISRSDDKSNLFRINLESFQPELLFSSQTPIQSMEINPNGIIYLVLENQGLHILRGKELVKVNLSASFRIWNSRNYYYGY